MLSKKVFILAAGSGERWDEYLGIPKQLIQVQGEPILQRTVRMLKERGLHDITIVSHDERLKIPEVDFFVPQQHEWIIETLESTQSLWQDRNLFLLGDVIFTEGAIDKIVQSEMEIGVIGRLGPNYYTGKKFGELFGMQFYTSFQQEILAAIEFSKKKIIELKKSYLWHFNDYFLACFMDHKDLSLGLPLIIDDETDDIDTPIDYNFLQSEYGTDILNLVPAQCVGAKG